MHSAIDLRIESVRAMGQLFLPPGLSTQDENMLLGQEFVHEFSLLSLAA